MIDERERIVILETKVELMESILNKVQNNLEIMNSRWEEFDRANIQGFNQVHIHLNKIDTQIERWQRTSKWLARGIGTIITGGIGVLITHIVSKWI